MPANLYGVANPVTYPLGAGTIGGIDITCNPGVETNVVDSGLLAAISQGFYYPVVFFSLAISNGATAPTALNVAARIGAGADFNQFSIPGQLNQPNYTWFFSGMAPGPISSVVWLPPGAHIFVTVLAGTTAVTCRANGTYGQFFLYRAPDQ